MLIPKVEKEDIKVPHLEPGESAIVLQRHEKYERDRDSETAGSLVPEHADVASERYQTYFRELFSQDVDSETMLFFVSSDTQYSGKGYRSMETAQLAKDAAVAVLEEMGIDPTERIINVNPKFNTKSFEKTGQTIRSDKKIVEPDIFNTPKYVDFLRDKYGKEDGPGNGISQKAWAMHEMDAEAQVRESHGAEGVYDVVDRTKKSLSIMERYSKVFHASNPDKKLLIWASSHYDTISPLIKNVTGADFGEYLPVDYGGGILIKLGNGEVQPRLEAQNQTVPMQLGRIATKN